YLSDLRTQLLDVLVQTIGSTSVEDLAITELQKTSPEFALSFTNASHPKRPKLVATLRSETDAGPEDQHGHSDAEHDSHGHDEHGDAGHGSEDHSADQHADEHAAGNHAASDSHGTASEDKSHDSHDASGHESDSSTDHGGAKSGHGAADGHSKPRAKAAVKYTPGMGKKKKEDAGGHGGGH
ncbi:MAG: hypothetical protein ACK5T6_07800, partial [Pirellula sp.]